MSACHISPLGGSWYPESAAELEALLARAFEESQGRTGPYVHPDGLGYVVPHAAPMYSGTVAAAAYRAIERQKPERIILLAFPHHGGLRGIATPDVRAIATPLGAVEIDHEDYPRRPEGELCDHSFEIQLPFLQKTAPEARITPLYIGRQTGDERRALAERLASRWRPGVVFLASSDFTHYGRSFHYTPFPPDSHAPSRLRDLDFECAAAAGSLDSSLFLEVLADTGATVCGAAPIALLIETLRALGRGEVYQTTLDYQTSGEITGDFHHSVSYAALGYHRREAFELSGEDREALLTSAEATLERLRASGRREPVPARGSPALESTRGVFVSLHHGGELLGCIGNTHGREPLAVSAADLAISAATEDPRFRPAARAQGPIDIEISVLGPMRRIRDESGFEIGRHGAMLKLGNRTALLLPQVAGTFGWTTAAEFLNSLARKAMLPKDAWRRREARLFVFEAQVFSRPGLRG